MRKTEYTSYPKALDRLASDIRSRRFAFGEYYIVLCPDRYTQTVEQALFCGGGALDVEVLTLSRLSRRICPAAKTLSKEGGVMITARAIAAVKQDLKYYVKAAGFADFAREAYETLQQIASSDASANAVKAVGATKMKLDDLSLIKTEYDKIKGEYSDAPDKLYALIRAAETSELIKNARFYAIGYADMTKLIERVFNVLSKYAKAFTLYSAPPADTKRDSLDLFCAPDRIGEYKQVAAEIREHVFNGGKYEDVAVVCDKPRALKRILEEYEIPTYADESKPLYFTPPLSAVENMYRLFAAYARHNAVDCTALVALCKNPYIGCDRGDAEKLQYEVQTRALSFVPDGYEFRLPQSNRAAKRVLNIVREFSACKDFGCAVKRLVELCDFESVQNSIGGTNEVEPLISLTDLLSRYGSGDFDADCKALLSAAQTVDVNTLPRERDCVTITMPQSLRMTAVKKLFITDFNEGALPVTVSDTGLISDGELNALGGVIEPTCAGRNRQSRDELKAVAVNAGSVFITYSDADGRAAAFISELAKKINKLDQSEQSDVLLYSDDPAFIAKFACVPSAARELAARRQSKHCETVLSATAKSEVFTQSFSDIVAQEKRATISVSELSHWFTCPYQRFLRDAMGLKERKRGFGAPDFGIVVHDFMRRFVQKTPYDCSEEAVKKIIDEALTEADIKLDNATYSRMLSDAVDYATVNARILEKGKYAPAQTEYRFGGKTLGTNSQLEFIGYIDRFDVCGDRARIIDYKTGNKKFKIDRCLNGCDMQLPLYAYALPYDVTGMFYVRAPKRYNTGKPDRAMSGCMVMDVDVALEYDVELSPDGEASDIIPARLKADKDGVLNFSGRSAALLEECEFDELIQKCKNNADVAVDEICLGYVSRSPVEGACERCAYIGICGGGVPRVFDNETEDDE